MRPGKSADVADKSIRTILETDRVWSAYALADLSPPWREYAEWSIRGDSLCLIYRGLAPPVLFAVGEPEQLKALFADLSPGEYWFTLRPTDFALLRGRLDTFSRVRMWRMRLTDFLRPSTRGDTTRLGVQDLEAIELLFGHHPDRPDAYVPKQVEQGVYFGVYDEGELLSVAGTHVFDPVLGIAALGNVFTTPDHRRRGFGTSVSAAVVEHLLQLGIVTIVLNVEMANETAVEIYRRMGFMPYCGFYEGTSVLL